jgi:hypothetical protein
MNEEGKTGVVLGRVARASQSDFKFKRYAFLLQNSFGCLTVSSVKLML